MHVYNWIMNSTVLYCTVRLLTCGGFRFFFGKHYKCAYWPGWPIPYPSECAKGVRGGITWRLLLLRWAHWAELKSQAKHSRLRQNKTIRIMLSLNLYNHCDDLEGSNPSTRLTSPSEAVKVEVVVGWLTNDYQVFPEGQLQKRGGSACDTQVL